MTLVGYFLYAMFYSVLGTACMLALYTFAFIINMMLPVRDVEKPKIVRYVEYNHKPFKD